LLGLSWHRKKNFMSPPREPLSLRLRNGTAEQHRHVEAGVSVMSPEFSLSHYKSLLFRSYEFFRAYELALKDWAHLKIPHFAERMRRSELLKHDLEHLGLALPLTMASFPVPRSEAEVLGVMYVMEGSTLGGQVICRHLRESLQLPDSALNFYRGYGPETGKYWQEFKHHLDRFNDQPESFSVACVTSAQKTFELFGAHLSTSV